MERQLITPCKGSKVGVLAASPGNQGEEDD